MNDAKIEKLWTTAIAAATALAVLALLQLIAPAALAEPAKAAVKTKTTAANPAEAALARFRALEGEWTGTNSKGAPVELRYELVADGTVVLEHLKIAGEHDMVTMYHLDGDDVMLTHYCAAGNQPRMRMAAADLATGEVRFEFVDVTNLAQEGAGHMGRAVFELAGDRMRSAWTWQENGEDAFTEVINIERASNKVASH